MNLRYHLVVLVLIVSLAIISINVSTTLTGKVYDIGIRSVVGPREGKPTITQISVYPNTVKNGEILIIDLKPGSQGVFREVKFCRTTGLCVGKVTLNTLCKSGGVPEESFKCFEPLIIKHTIPNFWYEGNYLVKAYDYGMQEYIVAPFEIKGLSKDRAPLPRLATGPGT